LLTRWWRRVEEEGRLTTAKTQKPFNTHRYSSHYHTTTTMPSSSSSTTSFTPPKYDHFGHEGQAKLYSRYRPTYPPKLLKLMMEKAEEMKIEKRVLVDICCGSGQVGR